MQKAYFDRKTGMWNIIKETPFFESIKIRYIDFHAPDVRISTELGTPFIFFDDDIKCDIQGDVGHRFAVCKKVVS